MQGYMPVCAGDPWLASRQIGKIGNFIGFIAPRTTRYATSNLPPRRPVAVLLGSSVSL